MRLKELTLRGFKTFADKTSLLIDSPPSITAIVGPNGCGKSNVVDALRFVLGEQSMKDLRGESLEDVIFAGSSGRKALSLAEVSIVIDNSDRRLKTDYSEIQIKRRVFRSGESEFYINKNLCRLKDIKELFMDTGIGNGAYSIVNQGQIDSILSSRPEDRRQVFEEAAAIGKYKFRKRAAERRLIGTEQNLLRINDLRGEIKDNLSSLETQAEKAREYLDLKERLMALEIGLGKKLLRSLEEKRNGFLARIDDLKKKTSGSEAVTLKEEDDRSKIRNKLKEIDALIDAARSEISRLRGSFEEAKGSINVGKERISQLTERISEIKKENEKIGTLLGAKLQKLDIKEKEIGSFLDRQKDPKFLLDEAKKTLDEVNKKTEDALRNWSSLKNPIHEKDIELSSKRHSLKEIALAVNFTEETISKDKAFLDNLRGLKEDIMSLEKEMEGLSGVSEDIKRSIISRKDAIFKKIDMEIGVLEKNISDKKAHLEMILIQREQEKDSLSRLESSSLEMSDMFRELEKKTADLNLEKEKAIAALAETRLNCSNFDDTSKQKRDEIESIRAETSAAESDIKDKGSEIISLSERLIAAQKEIDGCEAILPKFAGEEKVIEAKLQALLSEKAAKQAKLEALEEKIRSMTGEERVVRDELAKEEVGLAKIEGELNAIAMLMEQEYQLSCGQVLESELPEAPNASRAKEEIETLKSGIRAIGPVNLLAVEEFEASKERLSFIETQYNDLVSARGNLNSLIRDLDGEARQKFSAMISDVNRYFSEIFTSLFEGGEARIELAPGDVLEAGIDIMARPSGKKWLNISLMSGGEKALTAIAILFSLMKINPGPFCFMDEVDAALDEINTIRFGKLLKEFSSNMQAVVITHSKRTMASAGTLYGITMEEPGISKLVSMKLVKVAD
ncbi:MAG: AAA family ATPase [Candidatus Saganbacteria bacterium]|nr:AAA family ATPase [Candidatus Saganbacteria bacterium]